MFWPFKKKELSWQEKIDKGLRTNDFFLWREGYEESQKHNYDIEEIRKDLQKAKKDSK